MEVYTYDLLRKIYVSASSEWYSNWDAQSWRNVEKPCVF